MRKKLFALFMSCILLLSSAVTLSAAAQMDYERVFCVFQPHTYSRTAELFDDFASSLAKGGAYEVILAPIYSARETNIYEKYWIR